MMNLAFEVTGVRPAVHTVTPAVLFGVRITRTGDTPPVHAIGLRAQIQIDARRRRYGGDERRRLADVFGAPEAWSRSVKPLVWVHATSLVPAFDTSVDIELPVMCTYDFDVAAAKYFHAVRDGEIPLRFLFSGTAFLGGPGGVTRAPVPWSCEATFAMPAGTWRSAMDAFFPDSAWIRISRDTLDALHAYRTSEAATDWDRTIESLLQKAAMKEPA